mgnify:FL=1
MLDVLQGVIAEKIGGGYPRNTCNTVVRYNINAKEGESLEKEQNAKAANNAKAEKEEKVRSTDFFVVLTVVGFVLGVILGFILKNIPLFIVAWTVIGAAVGLVLDDSKDKKDKENKQEKEERNV